MNYVLESGDENVLKNESSVLFVFLPIAIFLFANGSILLLLITGSILDHGSAPDHLVPLAQVLLAIEVASF